MSLKEPLTIEEQLEKLKLLGLDISDDTKTKQLLIETNYYRFSGYALQFRINPRKSNLTKGTSFETIYNIYKFDEELRDVLRNYIEKAEVYFRSLIAHNFSLIKCKDYPHEQHYDENNFYNKKGYKEVMLGFIKEENYYKDSLIVKHHKAKYSNKMPLWVIVELMSFSNLSKLYSSMYLSEKELIAKQIGTGHKTLENNLHCLSVLRNKCAHAARLYNTHFNPPVMFNKQFLKNNPSVKIDSLFAYLLILIKRLPDKTMKEALIDDIISIVKRYIKDINLSLIGFPNNFEIIMKKFE